MAKHEDLKTGLTQSIYFYNNELFKPFMSKMMTQAKAKRFKAVRKKDLLLKTLHNGCIFM